MTDPHKLAVSLTRSERKAMLTRDGQGEFSSAIFKRLLAKGLVENSLRFSDLGYAVRAALIEEAGRG